MRKAHSPMKSVHPLCNAQWIWPWSNWEGLQNTFSQFRHDFVLPSVPRKAPLHISADQGYRLYINGQYVGRGPARGYQARWPFDTYDVAAYLRKGDNWISAVGYNPGISTFQYLHEGVAGLICAAQWGATKIYSGPSWKMRQAPGFRRLTGRLSMQQNFQECFDARLDDEAWIVSADSPAGGGWSGGRCGEGGAKWFGVMP